MIHSLIRLGFCVKRHIDIETFTPEPYWLLSLGIMKRGRSIKAQWDSGRSFNQNKVQKLITTCFEESTVPPTAKVTAVVSKDKKQGRPTPLNTVALLKACSKALGIGPHQAMQTAESLYLSGYLSYPRTESTAYPKSFDIRDTLSQQTGDSRWGNYVSDLIRTGSLKARGGVDMVSLEMLFFGMTTDVAHVSKTKNHMFINVSNKGRPSSHHPNETS